MYSEVGFYMMAACWTWIVVNSASIRPPPLPQPRRPVFTCSLGKWSARVAPLAVGGLWSLHALGLRQIYTLLRPQRSRDALRRSAKKSVQAACERSVHGRLRVRKRRGALIYTPASSLRRSGVIYLRGSTG